MNEKNEPDYAEFRRVMLDNLKRNDVVLKRATMQNPYLIMLFVARSVGEEKCGRAFWSHWRGSSLREDSITSAWLR